MESLLTSSLVGRGIRHSSKFLSESFRPWESTDVEAQLREIRRLMAVCDIVDVSSYFLAYDRTRAGLVTPEQARRALGQAFSSSGVGVPAVLKDEPWANLAKTFAPENGPDQFNWRQFVQRVNAVEMEQGATDRNPEIDAILEAIRRLNDSEQLLMMSLRANDRTHSGFLTSKQFVVALSDSFPQATTHKCTPVTDSDIGKLIEYYTEQRSGGPMVNWRAFARDFHNLPQYRRQEKVQLPDAPEASATCEEVLRKLATADRAGGAYIKVLVQPFDRRGCGAVSRGRMASILAQAFPAATLTRNELICLFDRFPSQATVSEPPTSGLEGAPVDYKALDEALEAHKVQLAQEEIPPVPLPVTRIAQQLLASHGVANNTEFIQYDPRRAAFVTSPVFRRAMESFIAATPGLTLSSDEVEQLISAYSLDGAPASPVCSVRVSYPSMFRDIRSELDRLGRRAAARDGRVQTVTMSAIPIVNMQQTMDAVQRAIDDTLAGREADPAVVESAFRRVQKAMNEVGAVPLHEIYQHDKRRSGIASAHIVQQALTAQMSQQALPLEYVRLICACYRVPEDKLRAAGLAELSGDDYYVDYRELCRRIDDYAPVMRVSEAAGELDLLENLDATEERALAMALAPLLRLARRSWSTIDSMVDEMTRLDTRHMQTLPVTQVIGVLHSTGSCQITATESALMEKAFGSSTLTNHRINYMQLVDFIRGLMEIIPDRLPPIRSTAPLDTEGEASHFAQMADGTGKMALKDLTVRRNYSIQRAERMTALQILASQMDDGSADILRDHFLAKDRLRHGRVSASSFVPILSTVHGFAGLLTDEDVEQLISHYVVQQASSQLQGDRMVDWQAFIRDLSSIYESGSQEQDDTATLKQTLLPHFMRCGAPLPARDAAQEFDRRRTGWVPQRQFLQALVKIGLQLPDDVMQVIIRNFSAQRVGSLDINYVKLFDLLGL